MVIIYYTRVETRKMTDIVEDQIQRAENGEKTFREALHTVKAFQQNKIGEPKQ